MPADRGESRRQRQPRLRPQHLTGLRRNRPLEQIEEKTDLAGPFAHRPRHIGGSDVAGADFTHVDPVDFSDKQTERNRSDEVGKQNNVIIYCNTSTCAT